MTAIYVWCLPGSSSQPFTTYPYNQELISWDTWRVCLVPHPWSEGHLWEQQRTATRLRTLIFWPVPRGHPSSFHSSWAIWERARQEPWGVSVCSLYPYSVLLKTGLSRSCQAYLNDTWEKRASPWFLSSPSFNYPMLNDSSVTLGIYFWLTSKSSKL